MIKQQDGKWHLYSKDGSKHLGGPYPTREEAEERERQVNHFKHQKADLVEVSLIITKASLKDGVMRWQAVVSDTSPDSLGESTSIALFQDWIRRVESKAQIDWLPTPRMPFLGISHYPSLDGAGEAGITEKMYIDGNKFKASGIFYDTPLGKALFNKVRNEADLIKKGEGVEKPIRISAAWWDISHSHGPFTFERKSLVDVCPMCAKGDNNKTYLMGQPDHWASTRVPIHPRTTILTEKAIMTTRKEDAESIVEELAEELEAKSQLVGKAEVESPAIVVKAKKPPAEEEAEEMAEEKEEKSKKKPKGGSYLASRAFTWASAKLLPEAKSLSRVELMGLVRRNLSEVPEDERLEMLESLLDDVHSELNEVKTAVEELYFAQPALETEEVKEMEYLNEFTEAVTEALESSQPIAKKAEVIQKALSDVALKLRAELETPTNSGDMVAVLRAANAPLVDAIAQLTAKMGATQQQPTFIMPTQKSITAPTITLPEQQQLPTSPITGQPSSLTAQIRRSVGLP